MEIKNEKFVFTKTLILQLRALILPFILPKSGTWQWVAQQRVIFYAAKKSGCLMSALIEQQNMASLKKHLYHVIISLYIWNNKIIFVSYLCCYFARTTNTCTKIITLQYELYIYILGSNTAWRGVGKLLRNSAIFEVLSYFLGTDDDGTSRSLCIKIYNFCLNK